MLFDLHIDFLTRLNIHDAERSTTLSNKVQYFCISLVINAVQIPVIDAEAILPEMENTFDAFGSGTGLLRRGNLS